MTFVLPANTYLDALAVSYLLGSIPFGYLLVHVFHGEDVRASGSGNIGATNVGRKSPMLGVVTLLLDAGKGLAAVLLVRTLFPSVGRLLLTIAALAAVLGHLFPVWLKFRGGKGVATSLGSFLLIVPKSVLCVVGLFALVMALFRYVSLGSVLAAAAVTPLAWGFREYSDPRELLLMAIASMLVIWKHRQNIGRLLSGTEPRMGDKHK